MSEDEFLPIKEGTTDPEEMERMLKLATEDPALQGPMFRMLLDSALWACAPAGTTLAIGQIVDMSAGFPWWTIEDGTSLIVPAFTTMRAAKKYLAHQSEAKPALVRLPARAFFTSVTAGQATLCIMASNEATLVLPPLSLQLLVKGEFSHYQPEGAGGRKPLLQQVAEEKVPSKLRQAIRVFCARRQGALAAYVFHPVDKGTGIVDESDFRVVVRLRDNSGYFFNDLSLMVLRMRPRGCMASAMVARVEDEATMDFLQRCKPLWPIL